MLKTIETQIFVKTTRGENNRIANLSAKGKSSQKAKHHYQIKRETVDKIHSNKVQKSIDKVNKRKQVSKEIEQLKQATKNRRAMFKAKRKAKN